MQTSRLKKTQVTPNSPFDKWLLADADALTADEKAGYTLFNDSGCTACHNGSAAGDNTFQKMGVVEPYQSTSLGRRPLRRDRQGCGPLKLQGADTA